MKLRKITESLTFNDNDDDQIFDANKTFSEIVKIVYTLPYAAFIDGPVIYVANAGNMNFVVYTDFCPYYKDDEKPICAVAKITEAGDLVQTNKKYADGIINSPSLRDAFYETYSNVPKSGEFDVDEAYEQMLKFCQYDQNAAQCIKIWSNVIDEIKVFAYCNNALPGKNYSTQLGSNNVSIQHNTPFADLYNTEPEKFNCIYTAFVNIICVTMYEHTRVFVNPAALSE